MQLTKISVALELHVLSTHFGLFDSLFFVY
jgi:hypothetical protein